MTRNNKRVKCKRILKLDAALKIIQFTFMGGPKIMSGSGQGGDISLHD